MERPLLRAADVRQDRVDRLSWHGIDGQIGRPTANPGIERVGSALYLARYLISSLSWRVRAKLLGPLRGCPVRAYACRPAAASRMGAMQGRGWRRPLLTTRLFGMR